MIISDMGHAYYYDPVKKSNEDTLTLEEMR